MIVYNFELFVFSWSTPCNTQQFGWCLSKLKSFTCFLPRRCKKTKKRPRLHTEHTAAPSLSVACRRVCSSFVLKTIFGELWQVNCSVHSLSFLWLQQTKSDNMDLYKCRMVVCGKSPRFHNKANILYNYSDVSLNRMLCLYMEKLWL